MLLVQVLNGFQHGFFATVLPHGLSVVVTVSTSPVPVTRDGLGVQGGHDTKLLCHTVQDEAGNPQMISHLYALTWSHLELPLSRHDLSVGASYLDPSVHTGPVVGLYHITPIHLISSSTAVVW